MLQNQFSEIILLIKKARYNALKTEHTELINLYWQVGAYISKRVEAKEWGQSVVRDLSIYIQKTEPELKGFSDKNLWSMKQFYEAYKEFPKRLTLLREISWSNHLARLQCLVSFELKADKFKPEHLGQLNFYLEALDRDVKKDNENPSIGVLLCKDKDLEEVEYALSRNLSPALVSEYKTQMPDKKLLQQKLHELSAVGIIYR